MCKHCFKNEWTLVKIVLTHWFIKKIIFTSDFLILFAISNKLFFNTPIFYIVTCFNTKKIKYIVANFVVKTKIFPSAFKFYFFQIKHFKIFGVLKKNSQGRKWRGGGQLAPPTFWQNRRSRRRWSRAALLPLLLLAPPPPTYRKPLTPLQLTLDVNSPLLRYGNIVKFCKYGCKKILLGSLVWCLFFKISFSLPLIKIQFSLRYFASRLCKNEGKCLIKQAKC